MIHPIFGHALRIPVVNRMIGEVKKAVLALETI